MPVEAKPLFRPDVLRPHLQAFVWPENLAATKAALTRCATDARRTGQRKNAFGGSDRRGWGFGVKIYRDQFANGRETGSDIVHLENGQGR